MLIRLLTVLCLGLVLVGCGKSEEEKRFHAELLDKALNDDTRKAGDQFLANNAAQPGVIVLENGLQYKVLQQGQGGSPGVSDMVEVHYEGQTIDGVVFDSSYKRGEPARFPVNRVIKGWTIALQKMKIGDQWMLYIPADLAYGARSPSEQIPPNSALIFKVELLSVEKSKEQ